MTRPIPFFALLAVVATTESLHGSSAQIDYSPLATVLVVRGKVSLVTELGKTPIKLYSGTVLLPGETIICKPGGYVQLELGKRWKIIKGKGQTVKYTVPRLPGADTESLLLRQIHYQIGLRAGDVGAAAVGATKPEGAPERIRTLVSEILSPKGTVTPRRLILQWVPGKRRGPMSLAIEEDGLRSTLLWSEAGVDSARGWWDPSRAREALERYRARGGRGSLVLIVSDAHGTIQGRTLFSLLSPEQEVTLKSELMRWDREPLNPRGRRLGRALTFIQYGMHREADEELGTAGAILDIIPDLNHGWTPSRFAEVIGGIYYSTFNTDQGADSTATWSGALPQGAQSYQVQVFLPRPPRSGLPPRTNHAVYRISSMGLSNPPFERVVNQDVTVSDWVTLGSFQLQGSYQITLTDATGEARGTRSVIANAIRLVPVPAAGAPGPIGGIGPGP